VPTLSVYGQTKSVAVKDVAQKTAFDTVSIGKAQYVLGVVSVSTNKKGNIVVKTDGNAVGQTCKYWQTKIANDRCINVMPKLGVEIVAKGKLVDATGFSVEEDGIVSEFPTKIKPTKITIFAVDDKELQVSFDGKTKVLIKE
jgi:hypothetical protein